MAKKITDDNFSEEVLESDKLTLVDFWAEWCNPCKMIAPIIEKLEEKYGDKVKFVKLNVDNNQKKAAEYNVNGIPNLLFFKDGEVVKQAVGLRPYDFFETVIEDLT